HHSHRFPEKAGPQHDFVARYRVNRWQLGLRYYFGGCGHTPNLSPTAAPRPRIQSCVVIRALPAGFTSAILSASTPHATMSSPVVLRISPGWPVSPSRSFGPKIFT